MDNIYLFHGENTYISKKKLKSWIDKLALKSDINFDLSDVDCSEIEWNKINESLMLIPLFGGKRLVVLRNLFSKGKKEVQNKLLDKLVSISESTILVIFEELSVAEKILKSTDLLNQSQIYHFPQLNSASFITLTESMLRSHNKSMDKATISYLFSQIGTDVVRLETEIGKLALSTDLSIITKEDVDKHVIHYPDSRIFDLADAIIAKRSDTAPILLLRELDYGTHPLQITTLLINQIRKMIILKNCIDDSNTESEISKKLRLHPYVLSKMKNHVRNLSFKELISFYLRLVQTDVLLKQGYESESVMLDLAK